MSRERAVSDRPPTLAVEGLRKSFGDFTAVEDVGLRCEAGRCLGLLGPNGAGKTTTVRMIVGLERPDAGTVRIFGRDPVSERAAIAERIGVQLQETRLPEKLTGEELLEIFASLYSEARPVPEVLDLIGLVEKRASRVGELSGGQRQRLALGCALIHRPGLLILDEPSTGLDPQARRRVWEIVESFKKQGGAVLLTTHFMEEASRLADDLAIVDRGRVISRGTPQDLVRQLGEGAVVRLALGGSVEDHSQALSVLPGAGEVERTADGYVLRGADPERLLSALFAWASAEGLEVRSLVSEHPTLEDVFVSLTGSSLRDG